MGCAHAFPVNTGPKWCPKPTQILDPPPIKPCRSCLQPTELKVGRSEFQKCQTQLALAENRLKLSTAWIVQWTGRSFLKLLDQTVLCNTFHLGFKLAVSLAKCSYIWILAHGVQYYNQFRPSGGIKHNRRMRKHFGWRPDKNRRFVSQKKVQVVLTNQSRCYSGSLLLRLCPSKCSQTETPLQRLTKK